MVDVGLGLREGVFLALLSLGMPRGQTAVDQAYGKHSWVGVELLVNEYGEDW
jgi:hypothetical protein